MSSDTAATRPTLHRRSRRRGLTLAAVAGLLATSAVACGTDSGDGDASADDTASSSATTSASGSSSPSTGESTSPSASASPSDDGDPVSSPVIDKAVKGAIRAGFPALVPAGVPSGWTVEDARFSPKGGGSWTITMTSPAGEQVELSQNTQPLADHVASVYGGAQQPSGSVDVSGTGSWKVYSGDPTALGKSLAGTSAVLTGPDQDTLVAVAEQLLTAEDSGSGTGDG